MKKPLSLLSSGLALLISVSVNADTLQEMVSSYSIKQFAENFQDSQAHYKVSRSMSSPEKVKTWFKAWDGHKDQSQYSAIWADIGVELINIAARNVSVRFTHMDYIDGVSNPIIQQDGLIDLERMRVVNGTHSVHYANIHDYPMAAGFKTGFAPMTSHEFMSLGKPGIGPDNQVIDVCKLGLSEYAPYLELSHTQKWHLAQISSLDLSQCLTGADLKGYWQQRLTDFVTPRFDRTERHAPGTSL